LEPIKTWSWVPDTTRNKKKITVLAKANSNWLHCTELHHLPDFSRYSCPRSKIMWTWKSSSRSALSPSHFLSKSKSKSFYNWRSVSRSVLESSPIWGSWPDISLLFLWRLPSCQFWGALSDERTGHFLSRRHMHKSTVWGTLAQLWIYLLTWSGAYYERQSVNRSQVEVNSSNLCKRFSVCITR
jgi:hypothetical protein